MDWRKYEALFIIIDQMIETSEPRRAAYFRGYGRGILFRLLGILGETIQDHNRLFNVPGGHGGDHYHEEFAQGYRDGCRGLKPEESPSKDTISI